MGGKGTRCKKSWLLDFKTGEQIATPLPPSPIYSCTQAPLSCPPQVKDFLIQRRDAEQTNRRSKSPHSFPRHVPICTFLCAIPAGFSHALCGEQGWYAGCQHGKCSPADTSCPCQAKGGFLGNGLKILGGWFQPFAMSWGWQNCSRRENDGVVPFGKAGCRR